MGQVWGRDKTEVNKLPAMKMENRASPPPNFDILWPSMGLECLKVKTFSKMIEIHRQNSLQVTQCNAVKVLLSIPSKSQKSGRTSSVAIYLLQHMLRIPRTVDGTQAQGPLCLQSGVDVDVADGIGSHSLGPCLSDVVQLLLYPHSTVWCPLKGASVVWWRFPFQKSPPPCPSLSLC